MARKIQAGAAARFARRQMGPEVRERVQRQQSMDKHFQVVRLGKRTIYVPDFALKTRLRAMLPELERISEAVLSDSVHGFRPLRNPVTNAKPHVGWAITIRFDLSQFFDHVTRKHLKPWLSDRWLKEAVYGGILADAAPRQGLPTSPIVANLAAIPIDKFILETIGQNGAYTRYADDLSISTNDWGLVKQLRQEVPVFCDEFGLPVNRRKTRIRVAKCGRRIICGVAVGDDGIYPTRKTKRKMRAARHHIRAGKHRNYAKRSIVGLTEWSQLKEPRFGKYRRDIARELIQ